VPWLPPVAGVVILVGVANRWGQHLLDGGVQTRILAPPLIGEPRLGPPGGLGHLVPAALVATALVLGLPHVARTARWRTLLVLAPVAAALWAVALALADGPGAFTRPMELTGHYLLDVPSVDRFSSPGEFLRTFTDRIDDYGVHVRSHPPGLVLLLWAMAEAGAGGSGAAAALVIAGGALAAPAVLLIVRDVGGEDTARQAMPFVVLAPAAVYVASTGDALFAGVSLWGAALVVLGTGRAGRRGLALAAAGGAVLGVGMLLSYGGALLVVVPAVIGVHRRSLGALASAAAGGLVPIAAAAAAGFWWLDGILTTRGEYLESVASQRPYAYFLLANLACLAIIVGPATVAGLARLAVDRRAPLGLLLWPTLAVVALANLSGMSKGEVERIWLGFALCLLPAAALAVGSAGPRRWLTVQAAAAIAIPLLVRTHW
jgi:hypothetical protein